MTNETDAVGPLPAPASLPATVAKWVLLVAIVGAMVGAVAMRESSKRESGPIELDEGIVGGIDARTATATIPGRESRALDRADVFTVHLDAGRPATFHVCGLTRSGASQFDPSLVVAGPAGSTPDVFVDSRAGTPARERVVVVRPSTSGEYTAYVYSGRASDVGEYQLVAHRGELTTLPATDCRRGAF